MRKEREDEVMEEKSSESKEINDWPVLTQHAVNNWCEQVLYDEVGD